MNVKELKKLISEIPESMDDCKVIAQKDPEGNGYSECNNVDLVRLECPRCVMIIISP